MSFTTITKYITRYILATIVMFVIILKVDPNIVMTSLDVIKYCLGSLFGVTMVSISEYLAQKYIQRSEEIEKKVSKSLNKGSQIKTKYKRMRIQSMATAVIVVAVGLIIKIMDINAGGGFLQFGLNYIYIMIIVSFIISISLYFYSFISEKNELNYNNVN